MSARIARIWTIWFVVMSAVVAATWLLIAFPLPGGSSDTPRLADLFGFFTAIGVWGTIKVLGVVFLPPIVMTYVEIRKARRD
jgi:hypothetical protein